MVQETEVNSRCVGKITGNLFFENYTPITVKFPMDVFLNEVLPNFLCDNILIKL